MEIFVTIARIGYWEEEATNIVIYAGTDFIKAIEAFRDTDIKSEYCVVETWLDGVRTREKEFEKIKGGHILDMYGNAYLDKRS